MKILQVNSSDIGGGAERVALSLHHALLRHGAQAKLAVGRRRGLEPGVFQIDQATHHGLATQLCLSLADSLHPRDRWPDVPGRVAQLLRAVAQPRRTLRRRLGREDFGFPGSWHLLEQAGFTPRLVHAHNLHGGYFDLRCLPRLSETVPVLLTLHDAWMLSGHCAHSLGCTRWRTGCGGCPDLSIYPSVRRDATAGNWRLKRDLYARCRLRVATPSRWLMEEVERSMLAPAVIESRVIPNGVDLSIFRPGDSDAARAALGLPREADILLFAANGVRRNPFKDYAMLERVLERLGSGKAAGDPDRELVLVALGEEAPSRRIGRAELRFIPPVTNPGEVARYYQAADVYLHAARVDTFPTVILEAMACGLPVVATAVGGVPEQVRDGLDGFLVPAGDDEAMASRAAWLLEDATRRQLIGRAALNRADACFDLNQQTRAYLDWYQEILAIPQSVSTRRAA
ncbi:MAG: glycosyltransferase [Phycisphaeraceae bacterium]|nr:glycosyltransferase [Phycisphaeraceae bacterium]